MTPSALTVLLFLAPLAARAAVPVAPPSGPPPTYEGHVRPIIKAHCLECHGEGKVNRGGLDLRLRRLAAQGGDAGPAIVAGQPEASLLYQRIRDHEMPPGGKSLSGPEIAVIRDWIAAGARTQRPEPERIPQGLYITEEERTFWAFQPIRRPPLPVVRQRALVRSPIDAFLLARLEQANLSFAAPADRPTLLRRLSFDLLGLPPTPEQVEAFLADTRPGASERMVDRLLASPHHGERWGRHWLDIAGYADSHGYTGSDPLRPHAWKYRDWVIRAHNADLPFDRFVVDQLAGDELIRSPLNNLSAEDRDRLTATGFLRTAPDGSASGGVNVKEASNQLMADTLQIVSTALLGLTMQCAQCHNHRYDPIPQVDYYRLRAIFEPAYDVKSWRAAGARRVSLLTAAERGQGLAIEKQAATIDRERLKKQAVYIEATLQKQLAKLPDGIRAEAEKAYRTPVAKRTAAQVKLLQQNPSVNVGPGSLYLYDRKAAADLQAMTERATALRATKPVEDFIDVLNEVPGRSAVTHLFHRGDFEQPRDPVAPGGLTILASHQLPSIPEDDAALPTTGRRLAFARQLTSGRHPLLARVIVNRVWLHHFGRGLVNTPGDLGMLGERPTHPELLDWLASEFMTDWSLKRLHRLILTSTAYQQASRLDARAQKVDPDNRLLWRMPLRRLEAEAVRDAVLAVSGQLYPRMHGKPVPVKPDLTGQVILGIDLRDGAGYLRGTEESLGYEMHRRSVYVQVRRSMPLTLLETFDNASTSPNCEKRTFSTVAQQALLLMNSGFLTDSASAFAERVRREAGSAPDARVRHAWRLAHGRPASAAEAAAALSYLGEQQTHYAARPRGKGDPAPETQALATLCHALLSSNAFLYVD